MVSLFLWMTPANSFAQGVTGKISGTVKDAQSGEALPGVNVMIEGTTFGAATTPTGEYFILGVPPGIYNVTANIIGYQKVTQTGVRVMVSRTTTTDFSLKSTVIESKEAVLVTAVRPTIIRDLTATAVQVDAKVFENTPLSGTKDMMLLTAGIFKDMDGDIMVRGGDVNQINFYVDGVSMEKQTHQEHGAREDRGANKTWKMDFNILGVQEMEVITGGFNAEYGNVQSGIVNIVTKEGGGTFHGEFRAEYGPAGQHHFGRYMYDHSLNVYNKWWELDKWNAYNNTLPVNSKYNTDSLRIWNKKYQTIMTPTEDHPFGVFDYRKFPYHRFLFGVGGPLMAGNKLTFFLSGEYRQEPTLAYAATRYFPYRNVDLTMTYRISPKMKLKAKAMQSAMLTSENMPVGGTNTSWGAFYKITPMYQGYDENYATALALTWIHTLSPTTFYEFLISSTRDDKQGAQLWDGGDNGDNYKPSMIPAGPWFEGIMYMIPSEGWGIADQIINNYRFKLDFTSQINPHHQLKFGSEGRVLNGRFKSSGPDHITWYHVTWGFCDSYNVTPRYLSGYVQEKMEYGGMIANLGGRFDYFDANQLAPKDPFNPLYLPDNRRAGNPYNVPNKTYTRISPRVGFSHPISDNTAFHFQYGHFYMAPLASQYNGHSNYNYAYQSFNNVNLKPPRTTSYEFGLQHNLAGTHRLNVVMYFNEFDDQIREIRYYMPLSGAPYYQGMVRFPANQGYGTSKGVEFTVDRTAVGKWYYRATYTLARVFVGTAGSARIYSANADDPQNWVSRQDARTFLRGEDRTHRLTGILTFNSPRKWGPLMGNFSPFGNWDISMDVIIQSGRPYTYVETYNESLATIGNRRQPVEQLTNLLVRRRFNIGSLTPQVFLRVTNLFNNMIMTSLGSGAGVNTTNNWWAQSNISRMDPGQAGFINGDDYTWFYNETRRFYMGVGFNF